jgi:RHS repeat-associated protein
VNFDECEIKYPTKFYNTDGTTPTKHIFANGLEIGTITGMGITAVIHYTATDHLTGSNLTTNSSDIKEELLDYMPFGTIRIDEKSGTYSDQRKYAGSEYDSDTGLNYMNARYYDGAMGRFISQDPAFLAVGDNNQIEQITGQKLNSILADPQSLNSYAYARNNPIRLIDPSGQWFYEYVTGKQSWNDFTIEVGQSADYLYNNNSAARYAMDHPYQAGAAIGVTSGGMAVAGSATATSLSLQYLGGAGTACIGLCGQTVQNPQQVVDYTLRFGSQLGSRMNQVYNSVGNKGYNFTDHAIKRIAERNVNGSKVINILQNTKPIQYFHEGVMKNGYYDSVSKIFIGQVQSSGKITTIIDNVKPSYINNLLKK